jgi:hypothetical protein
MSRRRGSLAGSGEAVIFLLLFSGEAVLLFMDLLPFQILLPPHLQLFSAASTPPPAHPR